MRSWYLVLILTPSVAAAQSQSQPQSQTAQLPLRRPIDTALPSPLEITDDTVVPLAGKDEARILSKNEAYNLGRAADGRLGIRLGNDMSFRITGN